MSIYREAFALWICQFKARSSPGHLSGIFFLLFLPKGGAFAKESQLGGEALSKKKNIVVFRILKVAYMVPRQHVQIFALLFPRTNERCREEKRLDGR